MVSNDFLRMLLQLNIVTKEKDLGNIAEFLDMHIHLGKEEQFNKEDCGMDFPKFLESWLRVAVWYNENKSEYKMQIFRIL